MGQNPSPITILTLTQWRTSSRLRGSPQRVLLSGILIGTFLLSNSFPWLMNYALNEGPWAFDGNILLLKELTDFKHPLEVIFNTARFWVNPVTCPQSSRPHSLLDSSVKTWVCLLAVMKSISSVLLTNQLIFKLILILPYLLGEASVSWCKGNLCEYHSSPGFCYCCGGIGHILNGYKLANKAEDAGLQYREWLWGSPIKRHRRINAAVKLEEKRLYLAYRNSTVATKAKAKLSFNPSHAALADSPTPVKEGATSYFDNMILNGDLLLQSRNEAFKRKLVTGRYYFSKDIIV